METTNTGLKRFEPQNIRTEVVKQMEAMQTSKFVQLPENYKESVFFALDKLSNLYQIELVPTSDITKTLINMFSNQLDFRKNHCYFFVQNDKNTGKSLRFGWQYQGLIHVAKTQCNVVDVTPVLVHEEDTFTTHYEWGALIIDEHIPTFKGALKGGYCVVLFADTRYLVKYYTKDELDKRRGSSKAPQGNYWAWEREMYEKTLINATVKRIIETSSEVSYDSESINAEPEQQGRQVVDAEIIQQNEPQEIIRQDEPTTQGTFKLS